MGLVPQIPMANHHLAYTIRRFTGISDIYLPYFHTPSRICLYFVHCLQHTCGFLNIGDSQTGSTWMVYNGQSDNPIKTDDLVVAPWPILGKLHILCHRPPLLAVYQGPSPPVLSAAMLLRFWRTMSAWCRLAWGWMLVTLMWHAWINLNKLIDIKINIWNKTT